MSSRPTNSEEVSLLARRLSAGSYGKTKTHCPLCDPGAARSKSLDINYLTGSWHCWRANCAKWGKIDQDLYATWLRKEPLTGTTPADSLPPGFYPLKDLGDSIMARPAIEFLTSRGVPRERWEAEGFGVCLSGKYYGRVIMPIKNPAGVLVGWIARVWTEKPPEKVDKYKYPRGFKRGQNLYNESALHVVTDLPCFVVEGALDVHHLWPDAVAVLGHHSRSHIDLLMQAERPLCILYDGDLPRASFQLAYQLRLAGFNRAGFLKLPSRKDPNQASVKLLREQAIRAVQLHTSAMFAEQLAEPIALVG